MTQMATRTIMVEDSAPTRAALIPTLRDIAGLELVAIVETVEAAVHVAERDPNWQLMVLDLSLSDGSGLTVLSRMAPRGDQRIVVLTNFAGEEMRQQCATLGADAVFDKATELDAFMDYCTEYNSVWGLLS